MGHLDHPWTISQKVYDHWKLALLSFFGSAIAQSVLSILYPHPSFTVNLAANLALALAFIPGFLYILSEFARLADATDASSKRAVKMMIIGFVTFFGSGVAIPHSYRIAFDAFGVSLPYDPSLHYLLVAGDLAGNFLMGLAAVFARKIGPHNIAPEPEKAQSMRAWLGEGLEAIGIMIILFGFIAGFGVIALAAFFLIVVGTILVPIGYLVRKLWH
jgi:hypothetical protein